MKLTESVNKSIHALCIKTA